MPGRDWPEPPRCPSLPQGGGVRRSLGVPTPPHLSVWSLSSSAPAFSSGGPWLASAAPPLFCSPSAGLAFASSLGGSSLPAAFSPSCPSASLGRLGESWGGGKGRAQLSSALQPPPPDPGHPPRYLQGVLSFPLARGALLVLLVDHQLPLLVAAPLRAALLLAVALRLPRRLLGAALLLGGLRGPGGTRLGGRLEALGPPPHPAEVTPYLVAGGFHSGVVLDLPQPLAEAFPLVGLPELLLALLVGEQVLGPQECPVGGGHTKQTVRGGLTPPRAPPPSAPALAPLTFRGSRRRKPGIYWRRI